MTAAGVTYTRVHPSRTWVAPGRPDLPGGVTETRNPILWPFSATSIWNTPIGDGVELGASDHPLAVAVRSVVGKVNYSTFSTPVNRGVASDSPITIREVAAGTWTPATVSPEKTVAHAPASVLLPGDMLSPLTTTTYNTTSGAITFTMTTGGQPDGFIAFIDETDLTVTEAYKATWTNGGASTRTLIARAGTVNRWDLRGDGWTQTGARASRGSFTAGLIRSWEVTAALTSPATAIRHVLTMAVNNSQLLRPNTDTGFATPGYQWPARGFDSNANSAYTGSIRMGTMFSLPRDFDCDDPALSPYGQALAYAMRDYGAYVMDRATYTALYAQQGSNGAAVDQMNSDWQTKILPHVVPVLNNGFAAVGGPGERVRPLAPDFA